MDKNIYRYRKKNRENTMVRVIAENGRQENDDKERRRNTRLGAVIAIVALTGALCSFLLGFARNAFNIMQGGMIYWYAKILSSLVMSVVFLIFIYIACYRANDLKRHDVEDGNYNRYDTISDQSYSRLLNTFKIYVISLVFVFVLVVPLLIHQLDWDGETSTKWTAIFFCFIGALALIEQIVLWFKNKNKDEIFHSIKNIVVQLVQLVVAAALFFIFGTFSALNNTAVIQVDYNTDGAIVIGHTSSENYHGLDIQIYNFDEEIVYSESVDKNKLLFAHENKYVYEDKGKKKKEGMFLNSEYIHWRYLFDLKEHVDNGDYFVYITVYNGDRRAELVNSFILKDGKCFFAKDSMEKNY